MPLGTGLSDKAISDPSVLFGKFLTFFIVKSSRSLGDEVGLYHMLEFQRVFQTGNALLYRVSTGGESTSSAEVLKGALVNCHQPFVSGITSAPGSLPFTRHCVRRTRHDSNRQLIVQQITVPVLAHSTDQTLIQFEHLKHKHRISDVNSKLSLVLEMRCTLR